MRLVTVEESWKTGSEYHYYPISDTHLGAVECAEDELRKVIQTIKADPMARWSHGGDVGDLITPKDKRFQGGNVAERYLPAIGRIPDATIEHAVELFKPIADKCWFFGAGNHESSLAAYYDRGVAAEIHAALGLRDRYIGYRGFASIKFARTGSTNNRRLLIDFHHGWQAGRLYGAFHVEAERTLGHSNADIILRGHSHKRQAHIFNSWHVTGFSTVPANRARVVACTGTFMHSVKFTSNRTDKLSMVADDTYAERKGYRPQDPLGPPMIGIKPLHQNGDAVGTPPFEFRIELSS